MVEVTFVPRVKTETATIHSPVSKCGDNWWRDVKVRAPYKGVDKAYRTLPSLGEPSQIERFDAEFPDEISIDIERVRDFSIKNSAKLSDRQRKNINNMLKRAVKYLADARTLQSTWARGFSATRIGNIPAWAFGGQPQGGINKNIEEGHARDSERWKQLIRAALRNTRCAEEVAKKATIRDRNKETQKGRTYAASSLGITSADAGEDDLDVKITSAKINPPGISGIKRATIRLDDDRIELPPEEDDELGGIVVEDDELEEGDIDLDGDADSSEPKKATKKKQDNTLLIAGAAAIGILALGKK